MEVGQDLGAAFLPGNTARGVAEIRRREAGAEGQQPFHGSERSSSWNSRHALRCPQTTASGEVSIDVCRSGVQLSVRNVYYARLFSCSSGSSFRGLRSDLRYTSTFKIDCTVLIDLMSDVF